MPFELRFKDNFDDKYLREIKKRSMNTTKFCSKQYKSLSKIADENIEKDNSRYAEMYARLVR